MRNQVIKEGKLEVRLLGFSVISFTLFQPPIPTLINQEGGDRGHMMSCCSPNSNTCKVPCRHILQLKNQHLGQCTVHFIGPEGLLQVWEPMNWRRSQWPAACPTRGQGQRGWTKMRNFPTQLW